MSYGFRARKFLTSVPDMIKFIVSAVAVSVIAIACCCYTAPEFTRSGVLRMVQYVGSQANVDRADKSSIAVKLISKAESALRGSKPMDDSASLDGGQLSPNLSTRVTNAMFGEDDTNLKEEPSANLAPLFKRRSETAYPTVETGTKIRANPFLD